MYSVKHAGLVHAETSRHVHLKSCRPTAFWVEFQPQWSVATRCRCPPARAFLRAFWCSALLKGGLITCAAAILKSGSQLQRKRGVAICSATQHSVAQRSTAQRSTAQHSTAQHSTAQHSTAQHSVVHYHFSSVRPMAPATTSPHTFWPVALPLAISSAASLLMTCTTYKGVLVNLASLTALPVASPCTRAHSTSSQPVDHAKSRSAVS